MLLFKNNRVIRRIEDFIQTQMNARNSPTDRTLKNPESPIFVPRQAPAIPSTTPGRQLSATPPPPQPPQRTNIRSAVKEKHSLPNPAATTATAADSYYSSQKAKCNQLETAANEAVKLVSKSVMMGSIQNLNSNQENEYHQQAESFISHTRKASVNSLFDKIKNVIFFFVVFNLMLCKLYQKNTHTF